MARRRNNLGNGLLTIFVFFWPIAVFHWPGVCVALILWWTGIVFILWLRKRRAEPHVIPVSQRPSRHITNDVMAAVMRRDMGRCRSCGSGTDIQFDHIYPWSAGGPSTVDNIQLLCGTCNRRKSNKILRR
jgi:HNH endonuclease